MRVNVIAFLMLANTLNNGELALTSLVPDIAAAKEEVHIPKTCTYDRVFKMTACDCSKMDLKDVPSHLRKNIEVSEAVATPFIKIETKNKTKKGRRRKQKKRK